MTTRKLILTSVILGLSAFTLQSYAAPPMLPPMDFVMPTDTNGDGKISPSEWTATRTSEFATIDTNNSGDLTLAEFNAYTLSQKATKLTNLDTDSNGQLSLTEFIGNKTGDFATLMAETFHLADSDNNDVLSATEFESLSPSMGDVIRHFAMLDQNYDLVVSQAEYISPPKRPTFGRPSDKTMMR